MKEEVGMKRRGPSKWLVGTTAATIMTLVASAAMAANPYTNISGVEGAVNAAGRRAGMAVNPGHIGQLLWGTFYDVRPVAEPTGATDNQNVNIQIVNTNPTGTPTGGVLARVRFRESKFSFEVLDFDIALSCAEVWTANLILDTASGLPAIKSQDPIVTNVTGSTITTRPAFDPANGGGIQDFIQPNSPQVAPIDLQRGYFEVISEELLPCEPNNTPLSRPLSTNTFTRLDANDVTPPNSLAGLVFIVRPKAGISYEYNMTAISRFVIAGGGSIQSPTTTSQPDLSSCIGPDNTTPVATFSGITDCRNQMDFALSKTRLIIQYDNDPSDGANTHLVLTFPTKHDHCGFSLPSSADAPFFCTGNGTVAGGGEQVGCIIYDRLENKQTAGQPFISPAPPQQRCLLPREVTIIALRGDSGISPRADLNFNTNFNGNVSGWLDMNLISDTSDPATQVHQLLGLDPNLVDLLGSGWTGFQGLPTLTLILQEYFNGNVGGVFGNSVEAPYEVNYLGGGS